MTDRAGAGDLKPVKAGEPFLAATLEIFNLALRLVGCEFVLGLLADFYFYCLPSAPLMDALGG